MANELSLYDSSESGHEMDTEEGGNVGNRPKAVRAPLLIVASNQQMFGPLKELLRTNEVRFMEHVPKAWDSRLFDEEVDVTEMSKNIMIGHEKGGIGLLQVMITAQERFEDRNLFWLIPEELWEQQKEKWPQLKQWKRIKMTKDSEEVLTEMMKNGLKLIARTYGVVKRKIPGRAEREAKRMKMESKKLDIENNSEKQQFDAVKGNSKQQFGAVNTEQKQLHDAEIQIAKQQFVAVKVNSNQGSSQKSNLKYEFKQLIVEKCSSMMPKEQQVKAERQSPPWLRIVEINERKIHTFFGGAFAFSNFHTVEFTVEIGGRMEKFWNSEQYYCYQKATTFRMYRLAHKIKNDPTMAPVQMKHACDKDINLWAIEEENPIRFDQKIWNNLRKDFMLTAMRAKFSQNQHLKEMLLATDNDLIGEANRNQNWGIGVALDEEDAIQHGLLYGFRGKNMAGECLMQIRRELQEYSDRHSTLPM
ncbi:hypothetical protein niasHT_016750 [Heterodera trifolii]|uniref:NADAR domain-containing protein n=1 Tax=Heterodera trifolii TaxID=157864 RepID=A0ABD2L6C6_9BILA